jgi:hypothetical protein
MGGHRPSDARERRMTFDPSGEYSVAWDYSAFPVWVETNDSGAEHVTIDHELEQALQDWCDRVSDAMSGPHGPDAPGWDGPGDDVLAVLDAEGAALAIRFQQSLGPSAVVRYRAVIE